MKLPRAVVGIANAATDLAVLAGIPRPPYSRGPSADPSGSAIGNLWRTIIHCLVVASVFPAPCAAAVAFQEFKNVAVVLPLAEGDQWFLRADLEWLAASAEEVCVPQNFVTDFASIPRPLWAILPRWDGYGPAAVVHDYLYWVQPGSGRQADRFMLEAMRDQDVGRLKRGVVYSGVRAFGWLASRSNARSKERGYRRVIPLDLVPEKPTATWKELRERIKGSDAPETCRPAA